jgi:membrane-associated PAP2 superfamily phosphatase
VAHLVWIVLHLALRKREPELSSVCWMTGVLVVLGLLGTFPSFFEKFPSE